MIVEIDPIAFYIPLPFFGWWPIYWYGISWLVAILSINYVARRNAPKNGTINKKLIDDFIFYGVLGGGNRPQSARWWPKGTYFMDFTKQSSTSETNCENQCILL